jgi:hypothetical protein
LSVAVQPDLAAFTLGAAVGEGQSRSELSIESEWFDGKSLFLLRSDNFGFAAPRGSVVIVDAHSDAISDRDLVIARRGKNTFARRLLRSQHSTVIGLAAETPDPRSSPQTLLFPEAEVSLHRVVGVIVHHTATVDPQAKAEAVQIDNLAILEHIKAAYEVREESAVPLALPGQIVLGGEVIPLEQINSFREKLAALHLNDGSSVFKRIGSALPRPLSHLRQFESIGGLGDSQILAVGAEQPGVRVVVDARLIVGVLYHS